MYRRRVNVGGIILRAAFVTCSQLLSYDHVHEQETQKKSCQGQCFRFPRYPDVPQQDDGRDDVGELKHSFDGCGPHPQVVLC